MTQLKIVKNSILDDRNTMPVHNKVHRKLTAPLKK